MTAFKSILCYLLLSSMWTTNAALRGNLRFDRQQPKVLVSQVQKCLNGGVWSGCSRFCRDRKQLRECTRNKSFRYCGRFLSGKSVESRQDFLHEEFLKVKSECAKLYDGDSTFTFECFPGELLKSVGVLNFPERL